MRWLILILLFISTSCIRYKNVNTTVLTSTAEEVQLIYDECELITEDGDVLEQLELVNKHFKSIQRYLGTKDPTFYEVQISELIQEIQVLSRNIISLAREEWTESKWQYQYNWSLRPYDFKPNLGGHFPSRLYISEAEVVDIYLMGSKNVMT
jgi:hypothetical protein